MISAVNNGFAFSFQKGGSALISLEIPVEIVRSILAFACMGSPQDFKTCTLVCRNWKEIVLGKEFYQELYQRIAPHIFGRADYLKYIGGDPGPEFPVPLEYLVKFRLGVTLLTFAPEDLTFTQEDGAVVVEPCNMVNIGKRASNAKSEHQMGYHPDSWQPAITEKIDPEDSHWSFIDIRLIEKSKTFAEQKKAVLARGEALGGLSDLSLSLLMTYVKTGVRYLNWGETDTDFQWARVPERIQELRLCVGFAAAGLIVLNYRIDRASSFIGVVVARKSFGH